MVGTDPVNHRTRHLPVALCVCIGLLILPSQEGREDDLADRSKGAPSAARSSSESPEHSRNSASEAAPNVLIHEEIHAIAGHAEAQQRARVVDIARALLDERDGLSAQWLLSMLTARSEKLLEREDLEALSLAVACLNAPDRDAAEAAALEFLNEEHGSLLRKSLRRVCSGRL